MGLFWRPPALYPYMGITQCFSVFQAKSYIQSLPQSPKKDFSQLFPRASPQGESPALPSKGCCPLSPRVALPGLGSEVSDLSLQPQTC